LEKGKAWRGHGKKVRLGVVIGKMEGLAWSLEKSKAWRGFVEKEKDSGKRQAWRGFE
jgi:hypothetical protein